LYNLHYTLGNIVLVRKRTKLQKKQVRKSDFQTRKELYYSQGTFSEQELCKYEDWTPKEIYERGVKLLEFMEERWKVSFNDWSLTKKRVLFLDFLNI
jgi:hypothetical protein